MVENQTVFSETWDLPLQFLQPILYNYTGAYPHILTHATFPVFQTCLVCSVEARRVVRTPNASENAPEHRADPTYNISEAHQNRSSSKKVRLIFRLNFISHLHGIVYADLRKW